jgi:quercetin dioxygenase-like cupin family protein
LTHRSPLRRAQNIPAMSNSPTTRRLAPAQLFNLAALVDYQAGAIVSRQLVHGTGGTVTIFAFERDEGLSEHTAPSDALVQLLEGEALILIAGQPFTVRAGDVILMPANQPHAVRAATRFKMLLTLIRS